MTDHRIFLNYINDNYSEVENTLRILASQHKQKFDEDCFHTSIIRCYNAIERKGSLKDKSPYGITSYLIRSYFNLINENKRAAMNKKRDLNYNSDNIQDLYEDWYNNNHNDARNKILSDLFKDFSVLYIMTKVEDNFDQEHFYLYRLKELVPHITYKKLQEQTKVKGARQKVVEVKSWLRENISKEEIKNAFNKVYGNII